MDSAKNLRYSLPFIRNYKVSGCSEIVEYTDENEIAVCFTADTKIITKNGLKNIIDCDGLEVVSYFDDDVKLNKQQHYEKAKLICNGEKIVYELSIMGSNSIKATDNHPFLVMEKRNYNTKVNKYKWKQLKELVVGDKIITPTLNPIEGYDIKISDCIDNEYLCAGWMLGDGWMSINGAWGACFGSTETYAQQVVIDQMNKWHDQTESNKYSNKRSVSSYTDKTGVVSWQSSKDTFKKYLADKFGFVTANAYTKKIYDKIINSKPNEIASFISGLFSADGCVVFSNKHLSVNLTSASTNILYTAQQLLLLFGIRSRVRYGEVKTRPGYSQGILSIHGKLNLTRYLESISFKLCKPKEEKLTKYLKEYIRSHDVEKDWAEVTKITKLGIEKVYDLALENSHNFIANGMVVHNCTLSSICLTRFVEEDKDGNLFYNYEKLKYIAGLVTKNLNRVIDVNYYPVEKAKYSNFRHRPIGIGVQGLADVYCMMDLPYDSEEARIVNRKIFETIYFGALSMSVELAKKDGPYETFRYNGGSPFSHGELQYHLWGFDEHDLLMDYDWESLIEDIKKYGTRNSLLTTVMPTASTSQIMGNTESTEPIPTNVYTRSTLAGEFTVINKYLAEKLINMGLWNSQIQNELLYDKGSVQNIDSIPNHIKQVYRTAYELKNKPIVQQAVERGPFIDQSQSLNLFCLVPDFEMLTSAQFYGWRNKIKTGMYYLKTQPAVSAIQFGLDAEVIMEIEKKRKIKQNQPVKLVEIDSDNDNNSNDSYEDEYTEEQLLEMRKNSKFGNCEACSS